MTLLILGLTGCGSSQKPDDPEVLETPSAESSGGEGTAVSPSPSAESEQNGQNVQGASSSVLVVYFSCTGTTKKTAEGIAEQLGADQYEIVPEQAYSAEDLNYSNPDSRTSLEQNDEQVRPAIEGGLESIDSYSTVFIGYPLWWGQAPRILSTFLESYDFESKTIAPFCTSGSSPIGTSAENLQPLAETARWLEGRRFGSSAENSEITAWLETLDLSVQP